MRAWLIFSSGDNCAVDVSQVDILREVVRRVVERIPYRGFVPWRRVTIEVNNFITVYGHRLLAVGDVGDDWFVTTGDLSRAMSRALVLRWSGVDADYVGRGDAAGDVELATAATMLAIRDLMMETT